MGETITFREHLLARGLSPKTIGLYESKVAKALLWFLEHNLTLLDASAVDLSMWAETLPFTEPTRRHARQSLKMYYEWQGRWDAPLKAVMVPVKPRYMCRALKEHEAAKLARVAHDWFPQGLAVLSGLYLALRASEIAAMRWDRFDHDLTMYKVMGKGAYEATIPVHPILKAQLEHLQTPYVYLFPGGQGRAHVDGRTILAWVKEVGREVGLDHIFTHQLRHTALATANDRLGDLRAVSEFARHRRVETTMIYTRTTVRRLEQVVESLDYIA